MESYLENEFDSEIILTLIKVTLKNIFDVVGNNDPYAYFKFNDQEYQTRYIADAGLEAVWN